MNFQHFPVSLLNMIAFVEKLSWSASFIEPTRLLVIEPRPRNEVLRRDRIIASAEALLFVKVVRSIERSHIDFDTKAGTIGHGHAFALNLQQLPR
jgi:hypothetical protein